MIEPTLNYVLCPGPAAAPETPDRAPAPAQQHRMAYWEWNDTGNPAHPHVIVCVHGLSRQGRDFDTLARVPKCWPPVRPQGPRWRTTVRT